MVNEARATVLTERSADDSLLKLCASGTARESPHMRQACMQVAIDRASPAFMRALTRGAYRFTNEAYDTVTMPFRGLGVLGLLIIIAIVHYAVMTRSPTAFNTGELTDPKREHTIVVLNGDRRPYREEESSHLRQRIVAPPTLSYNDV